MIPEENIDKYMDNEYYSGFYTPGEAVSLITILMAAVAIAAFLYPFLKSLNTGNELVFRAPFEAVAIVFGMMAATLGNNCGYMFIRNEGRVMFIDVLCWRKTLCEGTHLPRSILEIYQAGMALDSGQGEGMAGSTLPLLR